MKLHPLAIAVLEQILGLGLCYWMDPDGVMWGTYLFGIILFWLVPWSFTRSKPTKGDLFFVKHASLILALLVVG